MKRVKHPLACRTGRRFAVAVLMMCFATPPLSLTLVGAAVRATRASTPIPCAAFVTLSLAAGEHAERARLYTPPGVQHCSGGPGAGRFDMVGTIIEWVENGAAPHTLTASKVGAAGNVLFTRPLCEYPKYPHYIGSDPSDASGFRCVRSNQRGEGGK